MEKDAGGLPAFEFGGEAFEGKADDVAVGAGDLGDDEFAMVLDGVAAGFVEGMDAREVVVDLGGGEGAEGDIGAHGKDVLAMDALVDEADAGDDLVGASLQTGEHGAGDGEIGGFAEDVVAEKDEGIGAEDEGIGELFSDDSGLAVGVQLADFLW